MATLAQMIPRIFRQAWRRYGQPFMTVVRPFSDWDLPVGFAYNDELDVIQNAAGIVLPNPEDYWVTDMVYIVPARQTGEARALMVAGLVPAGTVDVFVLATDLPAVRAAHAVEIDGDWYDVVNVGMEPVGVGGATTAVWGRVTVQRRS